MHLRPRNPSSHLRKAPSTCSRKVLKQEIDSLVWTTFATGSSIRIALQSTIAELHLRTTRRNLGLSLALDDRLELVDSTVRHQRQKEMSISDDVGPNIGPLLHNLVVHRSGRALGAREGQRAELDLVRAARLPGPVSPIAIHPC